MAKSKKRTKKADAAAAKSPVMCFFFYGSIEDLGTQLAKFADESQLAAELAQTFAGFAASTTKK